MTAYRKKNTASASSPAVEQAARILLALGGHPGDGMNLTELCRQVGIHKSKGFSILNALGSCDLITRDERTKSYNLGPALMPLARKVAEKLDINALSRDHLQALADDTQASVLLGIICNDQFYIAGKYDGSADLSVTVRQYQSLHITHGAHGKAIFAFLEDSEKQRIIDSDQLFFHGKNRPPDTDRLEHELLACREIGYAFDDGELTPGVRAIGSPVFDHNNTVAAGIVVVGTFPADLIEPYGRKTARTARIISELSGASI